MVYQGQQLCTLVRQLLLHLGNKAVNDGQLWCGKGTIMVNSTSPMLHNKQQSLLLGVYLAGIGLLGLDAGQNAPRCTCGTNNVLVGDTEQVALLN